jgi:hypothetical protein
MKLRWKERCVTRTFDFFIQTVLLVYFDWINEDCSFCVYPFNYVCLMVFNVTFNNISVISWWSVLLMEETGGHGENHRPDKLYHICCIEYTWPWARFELTTLVVIGTDCTGSWISNYNMIMTTSAPFFIITLMKVLWPKCFNDGSNSFLY